jgi:threonine synthase
MTSTMTHLECALCGDHFECDRVWNMCPKCHRPLLARYDLEAARQSFDRAVLVDRAPTLWRYHELLPIRNAHYALTLGEGYTPLLHAKRLGEEINFDGLFIKDEGVNPTGSFKARGLAMAVSRAYELGVKALSVPSAGNAAGAMAAYAALANMEAHVYMPADVPRSFVAECCTLGAHVTLIDGFITDCGKAAAVDNKTHGRFDLSTLKEPYRLEGKKTMGYEVAEQSAWTLPDIIVYPTGGGTGLVGMWKSFEEMEALGWIDSKRPRMVTVQADGCAPIVRAFENGDEFAEPWEDARTTADGLRVPAAVGDFLILRALRESNGAAVAVSDGDMIDACSLIGRTQGIFAAPEGGATLAAFQKLRASGWIADDERVVLFNTGSGHKYSHLF